MPGLASCRIEVVTESRIHREVIADRYFVFSITGSLNGIVSEGIRIGNISKMLILVLNFSLCSGFGAIDVVLECGTVSELVARTYAVEPI